MNRIEQILMAKPKALVLREKDLKEEDYLSLAREVKTLCDQYQTQLIIHSFPDVATILKTDALHLPLSKLQALEESKRKEFSILGTSCHSLNDVINAQLLGCTYVTVGHIFETDCKKGLPGRGLSFLKTITESTSLPVYAIGGISPLNAPSVKTAGALGFCIMSSAMTEKNLDSFFSAFPIES